MAASHWIQWAYDFFFFFFYLKPPDPESLRRFGSSCVRALLPRKPADHCPYPKARLAGEPIP